MTIVCPVHGITDGYDARGGYFSKCRLCTRERVKLYKAAVKAAGGTPSKRHLLGTPNPHPENITVTCPVHGQTEAYTCVSLRGQCIACNREHQQRYRAGKKLEPPKPVYVTGDPWLTCNTCRLVLADRHLLYLHKREQHSTVSEPQPVEPRSLMPSQLGQR